MADIGYYTLPVIPSFRGIQGRVNSDLNRAFGRSGTDAGRALTRSASRAISSDKSIEKATEAKAKAADKLATATSRVRAAEASLSQAEARGNIAARARAVEAVAQARTREAAAIRQVQSATNSLTDVTRRAAEDAQNAGGGAGQAGAMGLMLFGRGGVGALTAMSGTAGRTAGLAMRAGIVGAVGVGIGALIAAPIMAGIKAFQWGAEVGLPLEAQMNTLRGVTDATGAQMAAAGQEARRLGSDINLAGTTADQAAAAMTELAKGGMSIEQAMAATRGTVQLATAGQLDAAQAAQYQSAAINMFQLKATDAGHVADLLAAAANSSSAEVADLGMALQQGGSVAAGFGLSLDETLGALTAFSKMGINSSDAGTMLKTSLQAITDGGEPAQEAINALGLKLYDAEGKFVGYNEMMRQTAVAAQTMTEEQFQSSAAILYGSDALRAAMIAGKRGPEFFQEVADGLANVDGAAARMAAANMQGLPGVIEGFSNTVDGMKLAVYDAGNAIALALGREALGSFDSMAEAVQRNSPKIVGFFTGIGTFAVEAAIQIVQFAADGTRALAQLVNVFGDVYGGVLRTGAVLQRITGDHETADEWERQAQAGFGLADGIYSTADALDGTVNKLRTFKGTLQTAGDAANDAMKLTVALGQSVASVPDGKDIIITNNTPETITDLEALGIAVTETPTGLKMTATTDEAKRIVDAWRQQQGLEPVAVTVKPEIDPAAQANIAAFFNQYKNMPVPINPNVPALPAPKPGASIADLMQPPRAAGGVFGAFSRMPTSAVIQPATRGLVQWAEPSTHGEAFIPLNPSNRDRSTAIWAETGRRLGAIRAFAEGGLTPGASYLKSTLQQMFPQITNIGGWRPPDGFNEHSTGNALDVMIPNWQSPDGVALGNTVAAFALRNADALGLTHLIWQQRTFRPGDTTGTPMGDRGSSTANHFDHVHLFTNERGGALPTAPLMPVGGGASINTMSYGMGTGGASAGSYVVDPEAVASAQRDIVDADNAVAIEEQQIRELKADASESQRMAAQEQLRKAKERAALAREDLKKAEQGDWEEADVADTGSGGSQFGEVGSIFSAFMKDTFGLGSILPDPSQMGIFKMLEAIMGITFDPKAGGAGAGGLFGGGGAFGSNPLGANGGGGAFGSNPLGANGGGAGAGLFGMATSMIPGVNGSIPPGAATPPAMPPPGLHAGSGGPPGPVDASTTVNVQGHSTNDVVSSVRRELQWAPRVGTYSPPGTG